jgi:hypothetical protein
MSNNKNANRNRGMDLLGPAVAASKITSLNIASNFNAKGGVEAIVSMLDNGALSKLDASNNSMFGKANKTSITAWAAALKAHTSITELNLAARMAWTQTMQRSLPLLSVIWGL